MSVILDEFFSCEPLRQNELDAFADRGVPPLALLQPDAPMRDVVVYDDAGRFEFRRWQDGGEATGAIIFLARSWTGDPMDLVAWTPGDDRLAAWFGYAGLLGEDTLHDWPTVRVHPSPMAWLQDARRGVVVVRPERAAKALQDAGPIEAADIEHARALKRMVALRPAEILVPARRAA